MATHSSTLAWRIPQTEEPGRPQSIWLERVRHGWSNLVQYSTGENTWTCNTGRDKRICPRCESLSVTAVCGGGCVMELGKRKSIIAQLPGKWEGAGKQILSPFPCFSRAFPSSHFPLYSMCLSPYSSLQWNIREGMDSEPQKQDPVEKNQVWYWVY